MNEYIECGRITTTHGVRGAIKVESWCDSPEVLASFDRVYIHDVRGYAAHKVLSRFIKGNFVVLTLDGIPDMKTAETLKGEILFAHRDQIPVDDGAMLLCDMIGLNVVDAASGQIYGTLLRIEESPASDLYVVGTPSGEVLLPAVPAFIKEVNPDGVMITPIPGFFDEI